MKQKNGKDKNYIHKVEIIAIADIQNGNKDKLLRNMDYLIKEEDYETCEGIQNALNKETNE